MEFNHKIEIDLLGFLKTGKFDYLKIGQTREWFVNNFPNPDNFTEGDNWKTGRFEIFKYGDIEIHFKDDKLFLIHADYFKVIDGGPSLELKRWIFKKHSLKLNLLYVSSELLKEVVDFQVKFDKKSDLAIITTSGKVKLYFENNGLDNYLFNAMSKIDE